MMRRRAAGLGHLGKKQRRISTQGLVHSLVVDFGSREGRRKEARKLGVGGLGCRLQERDAAGAGLLGLRLMCRRVGSDEEHEKLLQASVALDGIDG